MFSSRGYLNSTNQILQGAINFFFQTSFCIEINPNYRNQITLTNFQGT